MAGRAQATGGLRRDFVIDDLVLVLLAGRGLSTTPPAGRPAAARRLADAARTHLTLRDESTARLPEMTTGTLWLPAATRHRLDIRPGDPALDALILRPHIETACRRGAAGPCR